MLLMKKCNLGCGRQKKDGFVNVDWDPKAAPDVLHDLNALPYPFADGEFELVEAFHVLEHLDLPFEVMKELHRILAPGGRLHIKVPHFSRGFTHSEHTHGFGVTFPMYFNDNFSGSGYTGADFTLEKMKLRWSAFGCLLPNLGYGRVAASAVRCLDGIITPLANLNPYFCSRFWCFWVGGFEELEYIFRKTK